MNPDFRASSMHRRMLCPGSAKLEAGFAEDETDQAREGTLLHAYLADPSLARTVLRPPHQDLLRTSDTLAQVAFQRVAEACALADDEPFEEGGGKLWSLPLGDTVITGHTDLWRRYPRVRLVVIIDFKMGYKVVEAAASNVQLRCYALMSREEWPDTERAAVAIVQPRLPFDERLTLAIYEKDDFEPSRAQLARVIAECRNEPADLNPGADQCRYCRAKLICPAYQKQVSDGLATVAHLRGVTPTAAGNRIKECTDTQLGAVLEAIQFAEFIKDAARDEARSRIAAGGMEGYTLGKTSEMRKVVDTARAVALLTLRGTLSREDALACCDAKLGRLEEKVRERTGCTWKEARETVANLLADVIETEEKKPSILKTKPRKALAG